MDQEIKYMELKYKFSCFLVLFQVVALSVLKDSSLTAHGSILPTNNQRQTTVNNFNTGNRVSNRSLYLPGVSDEEWKLLAAILLGSHRQTSSAETTAAPSVMIPSTNNPTAPTSWESETQPSTTSDVTSASANDTRSIFLTFNVTTGYNQAVTTETTAADDQRTFSLELDWRKCAIFPACSVVSQNDNGLGARPDVSCSRSLVGFIVGVTILLAAIVIGSNVVVIAVILRSPSLRKPHGYFKMSLAVADLISGCLVLPSVARNILVEVKFDDRDRQLLLQESPGNHAAAIVFGTAGILSSMTAIFSLLLLSVDSFMAIRWPMRYRVGDVMTTRRAGAALVFVWTLGVVLSVLPITLAKDYLQYKLHLPTLFYVPVIAPQAKGNPSTIQQYLTAIIYALMVWGLPFLLTWCITIMNSVHSHKMLHKMRYSRRQSVRSEAAINKLSRDLRRTVVVVLALFTVTVLPMVAVLLEAVIHSQKYCMHRNVGVAMFTALYVHFCGNFLNVIVYNVCNEEFREECRKTFAAFVNLFVCKDLLAAGHRAKSRKSSVARWSLAAGRRLWRKRHGAQPSVTSATGLRTLSGTSTSTVCSDARPEPGSGDGGRLGNEKLDRCT